MQLPLEQRAERRTVRVTDLGSDLVDARVAGLEQVDGVLDAQPLEVGERRFPEHALHVASERPLARARCLRGVLEREASVEAPPSPALESLNDRVVVHEVIDQRVRRLCDGRASTIRYFAVSAASCGLADLTSQSARSRWPSAAPAVTKRPDFTTMFDSSRFTRG